MQKIDNPQKSDWAELLQRPIVAMEAVEETVNAIFEDVRRNGDDAVKRYTKIFDGVDLDDFYVSREEFSEAENLVSAKLKKAIENAKKNIYAFHHAQKTEKIKTETTEGVECWLEKKPIQKVGLYIPGGTAPLFSSVLMLAIPAKIAGCKEVVLATPPAEDGSINPAIIYAAKVCGIDKIIKIGGIQAIAGLTFGTDMIPKVYKIFGPGNQYVTYAKQVATKYGIAIDMPAGPSELLVVADETANASFVASDLLSQAEHGTDSQVILVATSKKIIEEVAIEIKKQISDLPRKDIAEKSISNSKLIYVSNEEIAIDLINEYAPEHFIIASDKSEFYVQNIENAGSVFIGAFTPESAGDYASGTNHTLPTNGYSKSYSGVNLDSFLKTISFQKISAKGIQNIGETIEVLAEAETLMAHKNAVSIRLKSLE